WQQPRRCWRVLYIAAPERFQLAAAGAGAFPAYLDTATAAAACVWTFSLCSSGGEGWGEEFHKRYEYKDTRRPSLRLFVALTWFFNPGTLFEEMVEKIEKLLILQDRDRRLRRLRGELAEIEPERQMLKAKASDAQAGL